MVTANIPDKEPPGEMNMFEIVVTDEVNRVVDAAYGLKGKPYSQLPILNPTFNYSAACEKNQPAPPSGVCEPRPLNHVKIQCGIEFIADYNAQSDFTIAAILITFPENITQDIWAAAYPAYEVKNLNTSFPAASGDQWVDLSDSRRLKIMLRDDGPAWFPAGNYEWSFPVALPEGRFYPRQWQNIWQITICDNPLCTEPDGWGTITTFVLEGFTLFEDVEVFQVAGAFRALALWMLYVLN